MAAGMRSVLCMRAGASVRPCWPCRWWVCGHTHHRHGHMGAYRRVKSALFKATHGRAIPCAKAHPSDASPKQFPYCRGPLRRYRLRHPAYQGLICVPAALQRDLLVGCCLFSH